MAEKQKPAPKPLKRHVLVVFQRSDDEDDGINYRLYRKIKKALETIETPREETQIDLWLDSPGGDPHATYKIYLELRARCARLEGVVMDYAKSAATMLMFGMDQIYMAPAAELGPLDAQIPHPDREGFTISALSVASALEFLGQTSIELSITGS